MTNYPSGLELNDRELLVPEVDKDRIFLTPEELSGKKMRRINVPEGVVAKDFRNCVAVTWMEFTATGTIPGPERIAEVTQLVEPYVRKITLTPEYRAALEIRGVPVYKDMAGLNEQQVLALQVLLDPTDGLTLAGKLKKVGVSMSKYRTWLRNPYFKRHMDTMARNLISDHTPDLMTQLVGKAAQGDLKAIQYAFEVGGVYNPAVEARRQANIDIVVVLSKMTEVIQKHVKDPAVLENIAQEFRQIAEGSNALPRTIEG